MNGTSGRRWFGRAAVRAALIGSVAVGCADSQARVQRGERPAGRDRTAPAEPNWQVGARIGGTADDSTLLIPVRPVVNERGVYISDLAGKRVTHFDHDGRVIWTFGRQGRGPGEFESPRDVQLDKHGRIWVLDPEIMRVTVLSPAGVVERMTALNVWDTPSALIPLADGTAIATLSDPEFPFARMDSTGNAISKHAFPWETFSTLHRLSSQFTAAHDPASSEWVVAFGVGDGFFHFRDAEWKRYNGWFAERVDFPVPVVTTNGNMTTSRFAEQPVPAALSVTMSPERIYILFGGASDLRAMVVDTFSRLDGSYIDSFLLPNRASHIAWHDGGFYVLRNRPFPEIAYLRAETRFP
jgi:hypothetical protein